MALMNPPGLNWNNSAASISSFFNAVGEGIYGLDLDGNVTFVNPAAAEMIGWSMEELIGKSMHAVLHHSHFRR